MYQVNVELEIMNPKSIRRATLKRKALSYLGL